MTQRTCYIAKQTCQIEGKEQKPLWALASSAAKATSPALLITCLAIGTQAQTIKPLIIFLQVPWLNKLRVHQTKGDPYSAFLDSLVQVLQFHI